VGGHDGHGKEVVEYSLALWRYCCVLQEVEKLRLSFAYQQLFKSGIFYLGVLVLFLVMTIYTNDSRWRHRLITPY
jgi:hypothetical protein